MPTFAGSILPLNLVNCALCINKNDLVIPPTDTTNNTYNMSYIQNYVSQISASSNFNSSSPAIQDYINANNDFDYTYMAYAYNINGDSTLYTYGVDSCGASMPFNITSSGAVTINSSHFFQIGGTYTLWIQITKTNKSTGSYTTAYSSFNLQINVPTTQSYGSARPTGGAGGQDCNCCDDDSQ